MTATPLWPPIAGYYKLRLGKRSVWSAVHIWLGQGPNVGDPDDTEPRGPYIWRAAINGKETDIHRAWPYCAGQRIDKAEYNYILAVMNWAATDAPNAPEANPKATVNFLRSPTIF